jgi:hypothetical protein
MRFWGLISAELLLRFQIYGLVATVLIQSAIVRVIAPCQKMNQILFLEGSIAQVNARLEQLSHATDAAKYVYLLTIVA